MRSPAPVAPAPRTRTLCSLQAGAIERTIPAQAVPCPQTSPLSSSTIAIVVAVTRHGDRARERPDERMPRLDARVDDADVDLAGRAAERPVAA